MFFFVSFVVSFGFAEAFLILESSKPLSQTL